jgi:thiol-disulfide isomerase/thioredoxin
MPEHRSTMGSRRAARALWSARLLGTLVLGTAGCTPGRARTPVPEIGEPLPAVEEEYLFGVGPRSLAEARGMVVIVEFWATYCDPCLHSFPAYEEIHRGGGVAVISVALDEPSDVTSDAIKEFAEKAGATFVVLWDRDQSSLDTYGLRKMPTALVLDRQGVLRHVHGGYEASTMVEIQREISALVAESKPSHEAVP